MATVTLILDGFLKIAHDADKSSELIGGQYISGLGGTRSSESCGSKPYFHQPMCSRRHFYPWRFCRTGSTRGMIVSAQVSSTKQRDITETFAVPSKLDRPNSAQRGWSIRAEVMVLQDRSRSVLEGVRVFSCTRSFRWGEANGRSKQAGGVFFVEDAPHGIFSSLIAHWKAMGTRWPRMVTKMWSLRRAPLKQPDERT